MKNILEIKIEAVRLLRNLLLEVPFIEVKPTEITTPYLETGITQVYLVTPAGPIKLILEIKANGQPRFARKAAEQLVRLTKDIPGSYGIFMAPFISNDSSEILKEKNIGYMDLSGNARISFWPVYIKTIADRNPYAKRRELASLYGSNSTKTTMILRVLLNEPGRMWKIKELASAADVSTGQVSNVKKKLNDREWIRTAKGGFQLTEPIKLLIEWAENYRFGLKESRNFYSMKETQGIETDLVQYSLDNDMDYALTEFSGGARYAPAVRYQRVSAYVDRQYLDRIAADLSWKEVSSGANIRLYAPPNEGYFYGKRVIDGAEIASPVQVYLDLKNLRGRGEEAAEAVMKEVMVPRWQ